MYVRVCSTETWGDHRQIGLVAQLWPVPMPYLCSHLDSSRASRLFLAIEKCFAHQFIRCSLIGVMLNKTTLFRVLASSV